MTDREEINSLPFPEESQVQRKIARTTGYMNTNRVEEAKV
jgi:hypothetical protein